MRKLVATGIVGVLGVGMVLPASAHAGWYTYRCWRPVRPYYGPVIVRRPYYHHHHSGLGEFLFGGLVGAAVGIAIDRARHDRDEKDDDDREYAAERGRPSPSRESANSKPAPGNVALRDRVPAPHGDLRFERLRDQRVKVAWIGDERNVRHIELFTADDERQVIERTRIYEVPFAATFDEPGGEGYLGVTVVYRTGETVTRMVPAGR